VKSFASELENIKSLIAVDSSSSHHEVYFFGRGDIGDGVPRHRYDVGLFAGCKYTNIVPLQQVRLVLSD
jgi:hypothetical protein